MWAIDRGGGRSVETRRAKGVIAGKGVGSGATGMEPVLALHTLEFLQVIDVHINDYYKLNESAADTPGQL
jgi:pyruvate/2-oxoglutarate/acetoin dehydrogenase E1 component